MGEILLTPAVVFCKRLYSALALPIGDKQSRRAPEFIQPLVAGLPTGTGNGKRSQTKCGGAKTVCYFTSVRTTVVLPICRLTFLGGESLVPDADG